MRRERLSLPLTCEFSASESGLSFAGLAVAYDRPIQAWVPTTLAPGVFRDCLSDDRHKSRIRVLWQHDETQPIGIPTEMVETADGLSVSGRLSDIPRAREAIQLVRDGVVTDLSVGFDVLAAEESRKPNGEIESRRITAGKLWEFSFVTWGASAEAKIDRLFARSFGGRSWAELNANLNALRTKFSGKTISAATRAKIQAAIDVLSAMIAEPESPADDDEGEDQSLAAPIPTEVVDQINRARLELANMEVSKWT